MEHHNSNTGYGVLVADYRIFENPPQSDILERVTVGDMVLCDGDDDGLFFMTRDVVINMKSGNPTLSEFVIPYQIFSVSINVKEYVEAFAAKLEADGFNVKIGAFEVSSYE